MIESVTPGSMKKFREEDLYVFRGRQPQSGDARAKKASVVHWTVWILELALLLLLLIFIGIALLAPPPGISQTQTNLQEQNQVQENGLLPDNTSEPGPIVLYHNRIDLDVPLQAFARDFQAEHGIIAEIRLISGTDDYLDTLLAAKQASQLPDLFLLENAEDFLLFEDSLQDIGNEIWLEESPFLQRQTDGSIVGFPLDLSVSGVLYNRDLLTLAKIDPAELTHFDAWESALKIIEQNKKQLGIIAPFSISMSQKTGMSWANGMALFDIYLASGLDYGNDQVLNGILAGNVEQPRLVQFSRYLDLLFSYAEKDVLVHGSYANQLEAFVSGQTAFMIATYWPEAELLQNDSQLHYGFIPHGAFLPATNGIFANPSAWLAMNKNSKQGGATLQFMSEFVSAIHAGKLLADLPDYLPAYEPRAVASTRSAVPDLVQWVESGHYYSMLHDRLPTEFGYQVLSPLIEKLADRTITYNQFADLLIAEISGEAQP